MTAPTPTSAEEAAHWALRLEADASQSAPLSAQDWLDLTAWLESDPQHRRALDAAEAMLEPQGSAPALAGRRPAPVLRRRVAVGSGLAIAAAAAAAAFLTRAPPVRPRVYASTQAVQHVVLEDGSEVWLDRNTRLTVRFEPGRRVATLSGSGHALLDVRHTPARPFSLQVGSATVRVLGTRFDVDSAGGDLRVAVARGEVAVDLGSGSRRSWRVPAGWRFAQAGASGELVRTSPPAVGAWTQGQLVYKAAPWSEVARDLSRCWDQPVRADPSLAQFRFSGVIQIGARSEMAREIELFAPVSVRRDPGGSVLKARAVQP